MTKALAGLLLLTFFYPTGLDFLNQRAVDFSRTAQVVGPAAVYAPQRIEDESIGIDATAETILILDKGSLAVLYQKNIQTIRPIASITKLLTALTFLDHNPGWETSVILTEDDRRDGGLVNLWPGEEVTVRDLFYLTLISSTNEAAVALARSTGIEDFVSAMNQKARELGMQHAHFEDVTGLNPENIASPVDLALLAHRAFEQPEIIEVIEHETYQFRVLNNDRLVRVDATDKLLGTFINRAPYDIVGAKTGYLDEAGYCLLIQVRKEEVGDIIIVLLGAKTQIDRWQETKGLVDWTFNHYRW